MVSYWRKFQWKTAFTPRNILPEHVLFKDFFYYLKTSFQEFMTMQMKNMTKKAKGVIEVQHEFVE